MYRSRAKALVSSVAVLAAAAVLLAPATAKRKGKVRGQPRADVVAARGAIGTEAPPVRAPGFAPQARRGFTVGDQWEPAISADAHGTVYVLYPQYFGVPGCPSCPSPTMILQVSHDRGDTWGAPRLIAPPGSGQFDAQVVVDPVDGRTAYAAWLQDNKSDIAVARSDDFGDT